MLVGLETLKAGFGWSDAELYDAFTFMVLVTIECPDTLGLLIPQGFSPNGDNIGDTWFIIGLGMMPGVFDMSIHGHPGKYSYCFAEDEEASPWEPLHVERTDDFQADVRALELQYITRLEQRLRGRLVKVRRRGFPPQKVGVLRKGKAALDAVIDVYSQYRLLTTDRDPQTRAPRSAAASCRRTRRCRGTTRTCRTGASCLRTSAGCMPA